MLISILLMVFQFIVGLMLTFLYKTNSTLFFSGLIISLLALSGMVYKWFVSKRKKLVLEDKVGLVQVNENNQMSSSQEKNNKSFERKYNELLSFWGDVVKAMEVMFYKANEVHFFTLLESDILQEEVKGIENVSGEIHSIKNNGVSIGERVQQIAGFSSEVRSETREVQEKLGSTRSMMQGIHDSHKQLQYSIRNFVDNTREIGKFLGNISQVANKTRTLSINAAIEASKSGSEGAGFAVLAREIRTLAENTGQYAKNINQLLLSIQGHTKEVMGSMDENSSRIERGFAFFEETSGYMENFNEKMLSVDSMIQEIRGKLEDSVKEVEDAFESVEVLQGSSKNTQDNTNKLMEIAQNLSELGEKNLNQAMKYPISTPFFRMMGKTRQLRQKVEEYLEKLLQENILTENDLFEPVFTKVAETNPVRYECKYQKVIFTPVQEMLEAYHKDSKVDNSVILDMKKYCSVTGKQFSQKLTGDLTHDSTYNYVGRIFDLERVDWLNREVDDKDFYVTSYPKMDLKRAIGDLVFPLYINGKRWGTGRVAFDPEKLP